MLQRSYEKPINQMLPLNEIFWEPRAMGLPLPAAGASLPKKRNAKDRRQNAFAHKFRLMTRRGTCGMHFIPLSLFCVPHF
jgi:hypothetical protein